ncbi:BQ5605_C027g10438 [Microbotryum silenes-dioicae]|uniref:BQ5605_C027g10438 protein n=1 Tax=Microbotryum silenes-dioicae TaxID=796604 RepID=A0A2X0MNK4_9BASI|nr:BQ5605_C027g10438 [Microbotryum silenes-dioicae]
MHVGASSNAAWLSLFAATISFISAIDAAPLTKGDTDITKTNGVKAKDDAACTAIGQFPTAIDGACVSCSSQFPGASACTVTAATRCSTGSLSAGACVTVCAISTFSFNGICTACTSKYQRAAACTTTGATKCNSGFLIGGQCARVCPTGFVNAASTRTCMPCTKFDTLAATCSAGKITTCVPGAYLNAAKNDCIACNTVNKFASACSSSTIVTACTAPYTVSTDKKSCVLGTAWSVYLLSSIPDTPYQANTRSPGSCGNRAVGKGAQVAVFDSDSSTCYASTSNTSVSTMANLVWDIDSTTIVYGTCKKNNALNPFAKARCRDVILTTSSCNLVFDRSLCSTLFTPCAGDQFRNYNGICQDCDDVYDDSLTCDIFNGATSCVAGDYLTNGTCSSCSDFDPNAASCSADGTVDGCNDGWVVSGNSCVVDGSDVAQVGLDTAWSYYPDSSIHNLASLTVLNTNSPDQYDCAESVYDSNFTMAVFDPTSHSCYAANATTALTKSITDVDGASVFVIEVCAANQAQVPTEQGSTCYDIKLDSASCQVNGGSCN